MFVGKEAGLRRLCTGQTDIEQFSVSLYFPEIPVHCAGQAVLEGELDRLVPLCAERVASAASASHRALAVATLDAIVAYPYHLLHTFRPQVHLPGPLCCGCHVLSSGECMAAEDDISL